MKQFIKVTIPELGACAVSIHSCAPNVNSEADLAKLVTRSQKLANKQGLAATYEASNMQEYANHRAAQRAAIANAAKA
jgi:hypothetical protein